ncbi:MAG: hypothetical protein ACTSRW_13585 [Candidatus Helarchaeota archaeon]
MFQNPLIPLSNPLLLVNFILWCSNTILAFVVVSICFYKDVKREDLDDIEKRNLRTWSAFFLILITANVLTLIWRFLMADFLIINILERISNVLVISASFIKIIHVEKVINKMKYYKGYYFTIILAIVIFILAFIDPNLLKVVSPFQTFFIAISFAGYSIFPIIYFYVSIKSSDNELRYNGLKVSAGAVFIGLGVVIRPQNLIGYVNIPPVCYFIDWFYITAPISIIIGIILIYDSFRRI